LKGRFLLALVAFVAGGCADGSGSTGPCDGDDAVVGIAVGECAPEFSLPDKDGALTSLSSFRGQVAVVDIAALW
jgi:cytochrome oxidase Cu insertion factor (SCO1/SenC/PrrC family)